MQTDYEWQRGKSKFISINKFKQTVNDDRSSGQLLIIACDVLLCFDSDCWQEGHPACQIFRLGFIQKFFFGTAIGYRIYLQ